MSNILRFIKKRYRLIRADFHAFIQGNPQNKVNFIGVTGTSGKSTTSTMIFHLLKSANVPVGIISTLGAVTKESSYDTGLHVTTPDSKDLFRIIKKMHKAGIKWIVLETSSHALDQGRFGHIKFDFAVYTNIKRDHLDWHGSWENYAFAKFTLIRMLKPGGITILNKDDLESYNFLKKKILEFKLKIREIVYSKQFEIIDIKPDNNSLNFVYKKTRFDLNTIGEYNIENWLAAIKIAENFQIPLNIMSQAARNFQGIEGRMQIMQNIPFLVIVDFAHNADSLEKSLISSSNLKQEDSKLIVVFGSAGLRDIEKRYTMGSIAGKYSDIIIVTAEDPRTEILYDINTRIIEGAESEGAILVNRFRSHKEYLDFKKNFKALGLPTKAIFSFDEANVNSRYDAIDFAIFLAERGDVIITQGKGHEKSLAFNSPNGIIEYPFTDQEAVRRALSNR